MESLPKPPGKGGLAARNLLQTGVTNDNVYSQSHNKGHYIPDHDYSTCPLVYKPYTNEIPPEPHFVTTNGDYGHFPRRDNWMGRPPVQHSMDTQFSRQLSSVPMYRCHSFNI